MKPVIDAKDFRIPALLQWVFNYFVHYTAGDEVTAKEQVIFMVSKAELEFEPWCATVECFSVLDQEQLTYTFKLAAQD